MLQLAPMTIVVFELMSERITNCKVAIVDPRLGMRIELGRDECRF